MCRTRPPGDLAGSGRLAVCRSFGPPPCAPDGARPNLAVEPWHRLVTWAGQMGRSRGRRWSRREFLTLSGGGIVAVAAGPLTPAGATEAAGAPSVAPSPRSAFLSASQRVTLGAAVARIVPASGPGDWSAADLGVVDYIDNLLAGFDRDPAAGGIYPGGPYRTASAGGNGFSTFQILSEAKAIG